MIKTILRKGKEHAIITIYKDSEVRKRIKIGDLLILKYQNHCFVKPVREDFHIALPYKLFINYKNKTSILLSVLGIYSKKESQERPEIYYKNNLVDLRYFVPLKTQHNAPIYILPISNNRSVLWYPRGGYARPIKIKNYVDAVKLSELIGFFFGDGSKSKGLRSFRLTNSEPFILKYCIDFLDNIILEKPEYRCQIIYSTNSNLTNEIKQKCTHYWADILKFKKAQIVSVNKAKNNRETLKYGSIRIQINSTILTELILYGVMNKLIDIIKKPNNTLEIEMLKGFLRGVCAAEGYPTSYKGKLRIVGIAFNPHSNEPILYQKLLRNLNINSIIRKKHNSLIIYRYENFKKLLKMNIFSLHPKRNNKFKKAFTNLHNAMKKGFLIS